MRIGVKALLCVALTAGSAAAVAPEHVKDRTFTIPIQLDAAAQAQYEQLVLYVSADGGKNWQREAVAPPSQKEFKYRAPGDGTYAFVLQTIDKQREPNPRDVGGTEPHLLIVVDTKPPLIKLQAGERQGGDVNVNWQIIEVNLNKPSVQLDYRTADNANWVPVKLDSPSAVDMKKINVGTKAAVTVRMQAQDYAGNADSITVEFSAAAGNVSLTSHPPGPGPAGPPPLEPPGPGPGIVPPVLAPVDPPPSLPKKPAFEPMEAPKPLPPKAPPMPIDNDPRVIAKSDWTPVGGAKAPALPPPVAPAPGDAPRPEGAAPLQYSNNPRIDLEYKVGQVGPSGLKAVELWVTTDDGKNWKRHCEDADLQSPISADMPGEGVFGFILLTRSGAGLARPDPQPGESPQMRLEIDTTAPACTLYQVEADPRRPDFLHLLWNVTDRNLGARPITLKWAEKPNGEWTTIAADIDNKGRFAWQIPQGLPFKVYLRLEARDLAGNVGAAVTPEPVLVDLTVPNADLTGIAPGGKK